MATKPKIQVILEADTSRFMREINGTINFLQSTARKFQAIGTSIGFAFAAPLAGAVAKVVSDAGTFEDAITRLRTQTGASAEEAEHFRDMSLEMSKSLDVDPVDAASAAYQALSTRIKDAAVVQSIMENALKLTVIGMGDAETLTKLLTQTMKAYGKENVTAAHAADILHKTLEAGQFEAAELGNSFGRVLGIASSMGISLEEAGTFIAVFSQVAGDAAEAVTSLRGILGDFLKPSEKAVDLFMSMTSEGKKLFNTMDDVRAMIDKDFIGTMISMARSLPVDALATTDDEMRALAGVISVFKIQGEGTIAVMKDMLNATGGVNRAFEIARRSWGNVWKGFLAMTKRVSIALGEELLPSISQLLIAFKGMEETVIEVGKEWIVWVAGIAAGAAALAAFLVFVSGAVLVFTTLAGVVAVVLGIIVVLAGLVGGLVVEFAALAVSVATSTIATTAFAAAVTLAAAATAIFEAVLAAIPFAIGLVVIALVAFAAASYTVHSSINENTKLSTNVFVRIWQIALAKIQVAWLEFEVWLIDRAKNITGPMEFMGAGFAQAARAFNALKPPLEETIAKLKEISDQPFFTPEQKAQAEELKKTLEALALNIFKIDPVTPPLDKEEVDKEKNALKSLGEALRDLISDSDLSGAAVNRWSRELSVAFLGVEEAARGTKLPTEEIDRLNEAWVNAAQSNSEWAQGLADGFKKIEDAAINAKLPKDQVDALKAAWEEFYIVQQNAAASMIGDEFSQMDETIRNQVYELKVATGEWTDFEKELQVSEDALRKVGIQMGEAPDKIEEMIRQLRGLKIATKDANDSLVKFNFADAMKGMVGETVSALQDSTDKWASILDVFKNRATRIFTDLMDEWIAAKFKADDTIIPNFTDDLPGAVKTFGQKALGYITGFFSEAADGSASAATSLLDPFADMPFNVKEYTDKAAAFVAKSFKEIPADVKIDTSMADTFIYSFSEIPVAAEAATNESTGIFSSFASRIGSFFSAIPGVVQTFIATVGPQISGFFTQITSFFSAIPSAIQSFFGEGASAISDFFSAIPDAVGSFVEESVAALSSLGSQIGSFFAEIPGQIQSFLGEGASVISDVFSEIPSAIKSFADEGLSFLSDFISSAGDLLSQLGDSISSALSGLFGGTGGIGSGIMSLVGGLFMADGGIVRSPTIAMIGEAGPEAVVPLHQLESFSGKTEPVTVIVNSPAPTKVRESRDGDRRQIEVMVEDVVSRSLATGGRVGTALTKFYDVRKSGGTR